MEMINDKFSKYQFMYNDLERDCILEKFLINAEFVEWLYENNFLELNESNIFLIHESVSDSYIRWKSEINRGLKSNIEQFEKYINNQNSRYSDWLMNNKHFIQDKNKYPIKKNSSKKLPNYKNAINRIKKPFGTMLSGTDLSRIAFKNETNNELDSNNMWFKKILIPSYQDETISFDIYCKKYFNGEDEKIKYNKDQRFDLLRIAYNYCINIGSITRVMNNELSMILGFINQDPITGIRLNDLTNNEIRNMEINKRQGIATSNVNKNIDRAINNEATNTIQSDKSFMTPYVTGKNTNKTITQKDNSINIKNKPKLKNINSIKMKKKQIAINIVKTCFNAKLSAAGAIYYEFINLIQDHINSYTKNTKANIDKIEK